VAIGVPLLQTKLQRPRIMRNVISRPHLWALIDRGLDKPMTLVCAGAGFGKSTLVSSWVGHTATQSPSGVPQPAAWLSLDANDNDPLLFFTYIVAALQTVAAGACEDTSSLLQSLQQPRRELLFTTLINEMVLLPSRIVLVLDDYSVIHNEVIDEFLIKLVRSAPQQLHLVLITRRNPPLPLPQLRAADEITEIRSQDLRFSHEETVHYLSRTLATPLSAPQIVALEQRSEGWIAGLKLAVLSLMPSSRAICLDDRPREASESTSSSRLLTSGSAMSNRTRGLRRLWKNHS
jgi:LuxR family maltose regulon positive regulatory protein